MQKYYYCGPVMEFNTCVESNWEGETIAPSEKKARNNLVYQWKKKHNRTTNTKITLPGKLKVID